MTNEDRIEAFQIGKDYELFDGCVVADIAFGIGVGCAPLFGGLPEECDVEAVGLAGVELS